MVYVHVNSNVKLVTVVLFYAYLYPMMCHMYGELKVENVILKLTKKTISIRSHFLVVLCKMNPAYSFLSYIH